MAWRKRGGIGAKLLASRSLKHERTALNGSVVWVRPLKKDGRADVKKLKLVLDKVGKDFLKPHESQISNGKNKRIMTKKSFVYVLVFFASLGGFLFGYNTSVISPALLQLEEHFVLTTIWKQGLYVRR